MVSVTHCHMGPWRENLIEKRKYIVDELHYPCTDETANKTEELNCLYKVGMGGCFRVTCFDKNVFLLH